MNTFRMTEESNEPNEAPKKKGLHSGPRAVGKFSANQVKKLLKMPNLNAKSWKAHTMNRSRRNLVFSQADIQEAVHEISNLNKTKTFDLEKYQKPLTFGSPDEVTNARKKLRVLATVLMDVQEKGDTFRDYSGSRTMISGTAGVGAILTGSLGSGVVILVTGLGFLTVAAGTLIMPAVGVALATPFIAWAVYKTKKLEKKYSNNVKLSKENLFSEVIRDTFYFQKKMNMDSLLEVILQILDDDAKIPADQRVFSWPGWMINKVTGKVSIGQSVLETPKEMEFSSQVPNASSLPAPSENWNNVNDRWDPNEEPVGGRRRKTRKHHKGRKHTRKH